MTQPAPSLLLLVPAYNEESRIGPVLVAFAEYFQKNYDGKFQLVVVLNGCRDNTLGVVQGVAKKYPTISALDFAEPLHKGGALIEGLKLAPRADLVGYVDADGATGPEAFHKIVKLCDRADCVIGSRWLPGAVLHQHQTKLRRFVSRCFHAIVQFLLRLNIQDTQCPAKVMSRHAIEKVHSTLLTADLAFDVNLLFSLKRAGFTILEVPIEWTDVAGSKVTQTLIRSSLTMFLSVVRLRLIYSPFYSPLRKVFGPFEAWIYKKLRAPVPLPGPDPKRLKKEEEENAKK
ncbi:MAG TPA: glycosyltransferase [Verrucomicrobiae bacterium]|nr:glycosyltransferase [Verrucomicrobiae bacterium]